MLITITEMKQIQVIKYSVKEYRRMKYKTWTNVTGKKINFNLVCS